VLLVGATDLTFVPINSDHHPTDEVSPTGPSGLERRDREIIVRLGRHWRRGDAALLLAAVRQALAENALLTLRHRGAGGSSLLRAAATEHPELRIREQLRGPARSRSTHDRDVIDLRWRKTRLEPLDRTEPPQPVAITGGLGGIGLALASRLVQHGHRVWLVDRRPVTGLPPGDQHRLSLLAATGLVAVGTADATATVPRPPFGIRHLVAAAGELRLGRIADLRADELEMTARAKSLSLRRWVKALVPEGLTSVLAFGAVESRRPHTGFGGYALANELLRLEADRLRRKHPRLRICLAEWSLWSHVGMGSSTAFIAERSGFAVVPPDWGAAAAHRLVIAPAPDVLALGGPQSTPRQPLRVIAGIGGTAHGRCPDRLERLARLCRPVPGGAAPPAPPPGIGSVVRATASGAGLTWWSTGADEWECHEGQPHRPTRTRA